MKNICVIYTDNADNKQLYFEKICFKPIIEYCIETAIQYSGDKPYIISNWFDLLAEYANIAQIVDKLELINGIDDADNLILINACSPLITAELIEFGISVLQNSNTNGVALGSGLLIIKSGYFDYAIEFLTTGKLKSNNLFIAYKENQEDTMNCKDYCELAYIDRIMRFRINSGYIKNGIRILDPYNTYIQKGISIGENTIIYPGSVISGNTSIGAGCEIHPGCTITDASIGNNVIIRNSTIIESSVGNNSSVGPYAYIRPESKIGNNVKIGDFVEIKKSTVGNQTKISHLTYVGDAIIGENVNLGCGTVTVNFDGKNKHLTQIKDDAFIGCNTNLVAPLTIGENSFVAAGSTVTKDVPDGGFAIARQRQINKIDWVRPNDR